MSLSKGVDGHLEVPDAVRSLVDSHREIGEEPLHLALYLLDPSRPTELLLLEVLGNFGLDQVSEDGEIMRVSFPSSEDLPIGQGKSLCLLLTNVPEIEAALRDEWATLREVKKLIENAQYGLVFSDEVGDRLLEEISK